MTAFSTLSFKNLAASAVSLRSTCALISSGANSLLALEDLILTFLLPSSTTCTPAKGRGKCHKSCKAVQPHKRQ